MVVVEFGTGAPRHLGAHARAPARLSGRALLAATVYVARNALTEAERELDAGLVAMHGEPSTAPSAFPAVALHLLKGLILLARGDEDLAVAAFERELALEARAT